MNKYFKKPLTCIYLDQYVTSGMFDSNSLTEWKEIRELLTIGVENNKIVCPMSNEHFIESSQKHSERAQNLDSEFYRLSKGYVFKVELFIISQLISSVLRKNNLTSKTFLYEKIRGNILSESGSLEKFDAIKNNLRIKIEEATLLSNELRKVTQNTKIVPKTRELLIDACKQIEVDKFIERLNDLLLYGTIQIRGVHFPSGDIPHWIDSVIFQLIEKHKITTKEVQQLILHLQKYGFDKIASLDIRHSLSAYIATYSKIENVGDQIDIIRIATGLPISDIFFTDKKRKNEIIELGLDKKYDTLVLSGVKSDLEFFIDKLKKINGLESIIK